MTRGSDGSDMQTLTALDQTLIDLINLGLLARQAQWSVVGPGFRELHALLDELAHLAMGASDSVAERAITLGHHPDGRAVTVAREYTLPSLDVGPLRDTAVVAAFTAILDTVITRLLAATDAASDDLVTGDLLIGITGALQRHAWMIRAYSG